MTNSSFDGFPPIPSDSLFGKEEVVSGDYSGTFTFPTCHYKFQLSSWLTRTLFVLFPFIVSPWLKYVSGADSPINGVLMSHASLETSSANTFAVGEGCVPPFFKLPFFFSPPFLGFHISLIFSVFAFPFSLVRTLTTLQPPSLEWAVNKGLFLR